MALLPRALSSSAVDMVAASVYYDGKMDAVEGRKMDGDLCEFGGLETCR